MGVLDIDLPIFSPEQALKPVPLLRKATQGSPYQATFRDHNPSFHHAAPPGLTHMPFTEAEFTNQLR